MTGTIRPHVRLRHAGAAGHRHHVRCCYACSRVETQDGGGLERYIQLTEAAMDYGWPSGC
jgi:hypothetical protein